MGVTEAGLSGPTSQSLIHLAAILKKISLLLTAGSLTCPNPNGKVCVVNTDNVPGNGSVIRKYLLEIANSDHSVASFDEFLRNKVAFHNTMVDRITSQRDGSNGMVPRCEPVPSKALVIEDLGAHLPAKFSSPELKSQYGVVVRTKSGQLDGDIALKLRVANGTHTAAAHVMALSSLLMTDILAKDKTDEKAGILMNYLDSYFADQILAAASTQFGKEETELVYEDWRRRLCHPKFGLSTFFITENGAAKGGIRIGPTIRDLIKSNQIVTVTTVFAIAAILRFLTPAKPDDDPDNNIYRGWLDGFDRKSVAMVPSDSSNDEVVMYADGLRYNLAEGWYEFRGSCTCGDKARPICELLSVSSEPSQPVEYLSTIKSYLSADDGGNLADIYDECGESANNFSMAVATLYARMVAGDGMLAILRELDGIGFSIDCKALVDGVSSEKFGGQVPLHYRQGAIPEGSNLLGATIGTNTENIASVVTAEVGAAMVVDLHTHLLPPSHGILCSWGIDELLTYHYLVAEYFITAPSEMTPEVFYSKSKQEQANIIWNALFIERSPISEACRGVITTLSSFGLAKEVKARDLDGIRIFYRQFRDKGLCGTEEFCKLVYEQAGVKYAVMTNIPFDANEAAYWRPKRKVRNQSTWTPMALHVHCRNVRMDFFSHVLAASFLCLLFPQEYPDQFRSALRVDPLLAGDRATIEIALKASGYDCTIEGARQYLRDWCDTMMPEYMMASTPHDFVLRNGIEGSLSGFNMTGVNEDAMKQPFAFVDAVTPDATCSSSCDGEGAAIASIINEKENDFLSEVLMKVCEERDLPLALKIGAHRGVNPQLRQAGDGIVAFADGNVLARLCSKYPKVRFLATFLSMNNQHEACVLASKFRNLHIYGCWWYSNNPSLIKRITAMRVEMLGTSFTAQHSDARVLDQLVYKWAHSRAVIAAFLSEEYTRLIQSGWSPTRREIRRDIGRLFGGAYEEFMSKSLT